MANRWENKSYGSQNSKNSALYNVEGNFKNIWLKKKKSPLYIVVEGYFWKTSLKRAVEMPEKRRLDEEIKIFLVKVEKISLLRIVGR